MCRGMIFSGKRVDIMFGKSIVLGHQLGRKEGRVQILRALLVGLCTLACRLMVSKLYSLEPCCQGYSNISSSKSHPSGQYELFCVAVIPAALPIFPHCLPYHLQVLTWHGGWKMGLRVGVLASETWVGYLIFLAFFSFKSLKQD